MTEVPNPALTGVPAPSWKCVGCTASFVWQTRPIDEKTPPLLVHDRGPFVIEVAGKTHDCCTRECARNVWFVKSLEVISEKVIGSMRGPVYRKPKGG